MSNNSQKDKKPRCTKCNYFDAKVDCNHCERCFVLETNNMIDESNIQLFKVIKNFPTEVN